MEWKGMRGGGHGAAKTEGGVAHEAQVGRYGTQACGPLSTGSKTFHATSRALAFSQAIPAICQTNAGAWRAARVNPGLWIRTLQTQGFFHSRNTPVLIATSSLGAFLHTAPPRM